MIKYVPESVIDDDIILQVIDYIPAEELLDIIPKQKVSKDIAKKLVDKDENVIRKINKNLIDIEIALLALQKNTNTVEYLSKELQSN